MPVAVVECGALDAGAIGSLSWLEGTRVYIRFMCLCSSINLMLEQQDFMVMTQQALSRFLTGCPAVQANLASSTAGSWLVLQGKDMASAMSCKAVHLGAWSWRGCWQQAG